jgi:decaprenyl-phosphate phosphoribosyltransferase
MNLSAYLRLMRPTQWGKNAFVVAPLFFGLKLDQIAAIRSVLAALALFMLVSSITYVFNDLRDVAADRAHDVKRARPLAAGEVSVLGAWLLLAGLAVAAAGVYLLSGLPHGVLIPTLIYLGVNLAYSLGLKQVPLLEMFLVSSGFILRLVAGALAVGVVPTNWVVLVTALLALLLVVGKRRSDLASQQQLREFHAALRFYSVGSLDMMISILASGTIISYLMFSVSEHAVQHFGTEYIYVSTVFVLFGVLRYIQLVHDGAGADDPSTLAFRDRLLGLSIVGWLAVLYFLIY